MFPTRLVVIALTLVVAVPLRAERRSNARESIENVRDQVLLDASDGELQDFSLFQAALIAGGVSSHDEVQELTGQFHRISDEIAFEVKEVTDIAAKLDLLLLRLHERVLTGHYESACSSLHRVLREGNYNCVSATLLYQSVGERCGLTLGSIAAKSHVLCYLSIRPHLYVETTCPDWLSRTLEDCPLHTKKIVQAGRGLSSTQLLGKLYYNLGVAGLEAQQFAESTDLLDAAVLLDPLDTAARENLLAAYNNWSLVECDRKQFQLARSLLFHGLKIDSAYGPLLTNDLHIHQTWVRHLCERGEFFEAVKVLEQGFGRRPQAELFDRGRLAVCQLWAEQHFIQGELAEGWKVLSYSQRYSDSVDRTHEIAVVQAASNELNRLRKSSVASQLLEQALQRYPHDQSVLQMKSNLLKASL